MFKSLFCTLLIFITVISQGNGVQDIIELRSKSKETKFNIEDRIRYAEQSVSLAEKLKIDSSLILSNRSLAVLYYQSEQYEKYLEVNRANLKIAERLKDSASIAIAYDNIAVYYHSNQINDSAYYYYSNALKFYDMNDNRGKVEALSI